jgi:hypothetical protein
MCTDRACYTSKQAAWIQEVYREQLQKHGDDLLLATERYWSAGKGPFSEVLTHDQWTEALGNNMHPDAQPAMLVEDARAGELIWILVKSGSQDESEAGGDDERYDQRPMVEKIEERFNDPARRREILDRCRWAAVCGELLKIDASAATREPRLLMAVAFALNEQLYLMDDDPEIILLYGDKAEDSEHGFQLAADVLTAVADGVAEPADLLDGVVIRRVKDALESTARNGIDSREAQPLAKVAAVLLNASAEDLYAAVCERDEFQTPESWEGGEA